MHASVGFSTQEDNLGILQAIISSVNFPKSV